MFGESLLMGENEDVTVRLARPFECFSKEEVGSSHEVDFDALGKESLKSFFFLGGFGKEKKVINIYASV